MAVPLTEVQNCENISLMKQVFFIFLIYVQVSSAATVQDAHQMANWLGNIKVDTKAKKFQVQVIYDLDQASWLEPAKKMELKTPLSIKLIGTHAMKTLSATHYFFSIWRICSGWSGW